MTDSSKNSKNYLVILGIIVGFAIVIVAQQFFSKKPAFDQVMMEVASELNKSLPMMVDQETRLDNAMALPGNVFAYNYTLVSTVKDSLDIQYFNDVMSPMIINNVKTNPDLKFFRDNEASMQYSYKDMYGIFIAKIIITKEDYQ